MDKRNIALCALSAAACAALIGLSGCVFGNREIDPPGPGAIEGYYQSQMASQITLAATWSTGSNTTSTNSSIVSNSSINSNSLAYEIFNQTITNPVYLAYDSSNGFFALQPPNNPNPEFPWTLESDNAGDLGGSETGITAEIMPNTNPNCELTITYSATGTYGQLVEPVTSNTGLPLSGEIALNTQVQFQLPPTSDNDCSALAACYNSAAGCDTYDNAIVQDELGPFVKAGVITATDIPNLQTFEYEVSYQ